ncbi:MAG TPA: hypothetical protein VER39_01565 [Nocardioidaceae bacterium]|nr:hypothetical protein [Nocardioidaceae bacterium]
MRVLPSRPSPLTVAGAIVGALAATPLWSAAAAPAPSSISVGVTDASVTPGQSLLVKGTLLPRTSRPVRLQRLLGSTWTTAASASTSPTGGYSIDAPTTLYVGRTRYRVHAPATSSYAAATSAEFTASVTGRGLASSHSVNSTPDWGPDHWNPCSPITYRVNRNNAPSTALLEVRAALLRVSAQTGLSYRYLGSTGVTPRQSASGGLTNPADTDLVIAWPRPGDTPLLPPGPSGVGGYVSRTAQDTSGRRVMAISDAFVVLDPVDYRALEPGFGPGPRTGYRGTRGQLLMHELAHTVGLGHTGATGQVMYPVMQSIPAVWGNGDAAGLTKVGVASRRCVREAATAFHARTDDGHGGVEAPPPPRRFYAER